MNHALRKPLASLVAFSLVLGLVPLHVWADEPSASSEEPAAQEQTLSEEDAPEMIAPAEEAPAAEADAAESDVPKTDGEPAAQDPAPTGDAASAEKATPKKNAEQKADIASKAEAPKLVAQATTISSLSMTVTPPEAGTRSTDAKPNVSVSTEGIASYTASWQDHTDVRSMEPDTLDFVAGNTYYALITLHPAEGYAFKTNGHKSMDVYTNDTYYGGGLPASLDIVTAGIYSGNGQLRMLVSVKATEVQPKYLCIGVSEGGTYSVATSDPFPHENMDGPMNLSVNPGDSVTLTATPDEGYVFKGFYTGIRQMDSSKEGYGFVTDYDPNSLVSSANPYIFTMRENVNIYALFAKPTITLHWSDIDNADLKEPVVFEYSGEDLFDAIKAGLHMSQGPNWEATAQIAGHIESGYFTPEPMSSYSSRAELDDANVLYDEVTEDMDVYVCMNKVVDNVEVGIEVPAAGGETTTPGDAYSSHTNWHWDEQTNKPYFSVPSGAKFQIAFDPEDPSYEPSYWTEKADKRYEFGNPFIGTFVTGETYYAQVGLKADFGYGFASANPYARDPQYSGTATVDGGSFENAFCDGIGYTDYLILAVSATAAPDATAHTVTFDTQGGTPVAAQTVNDGGYATEPTKPSKDGFYFLGWFEKPGAELTREEVHSGKFKFTDTAITEDKTLYAAWYQGFYGATYDLSAATPKYAQTGGRATFTSTYQQMSPGSGHVWWDYSIVQGSQVTVTAIPAEGSRFVGWAPGTLDSNDNMPDDPSSLGDIVSTDNPYTFTFDGRTALAALFEPEAPSYDLTFTFANLGTSAALSDLVSSITVNGTEWPLPTSGMKVTGQIPVGTSVTAVVKATDGAAFFGANASSIPTFKEDLSEDRTTSTFTFTMPEVMSGLAAEVNVGVSKVVDITYDANGAAKGPDWPGDKVKYPDFFANMMTTWYVDHVPVGPNNQPMVEPPAGSKYAGIEVTDKNGAHVGAPGTTISGLDLSQGATVKFLWAKDVTVTFDAEGGTPVPAAQSFTSGGKATEPTAPTKGDWTLAGWYTDESFENRFDFNTAVNDDITLYARWDGRINVFTYDMTKSQSAAGGTFAYKTIDETDEGLYSFGTNAIAEGSTVTLTATPDDGYRFVGWAEDSADGTVISTDATYEFAFTKNPTTLFAVFEEIPPTLTLHWTSVDGGDDLVAPIAIEASPGMNVAQALALDDKDMTTDVFATDGYLWSGYQMPKPMSAYKSIDDLKAERVKGTDSIGKGLDIYYVMLKKIDAVEMSVEAPACGTETAMVSGKQSNPPAATLGEGNYGPAFEDEPTAVWGEWETDHMVFFEGTLTGGNSYPMLARLVADFGYCFADDVTAAVDGATGAQVLLPPDKPAFTLGVSAKVAVEHTPGETVTENVVKPSCTEAGSHDDVVYCTACKEELSRKTVTDPALGHDWGPWEVVTKATEEADGLERRTCSRCTEVEERIIPKLVVEYYLAAGADQTHTLKSGTALTFTFKRSVADEKAFAHFAGARVDGKDLAASNFTATEGSVILTLNAAYLDTLATGSHTLTALFDDGNNVDVAFTVKAKGESKPTNSPASTSGSTKAAAKTAGGKSSGLPKTGDPLAGPTALLLVVAGFVLVADGMRRRRA